MLKRGFVPIALLVALVAGCSSSTSDKGSDGEADSESNSAQAGPINADNPKVAALIDQRFGDCLKTLKAGKVTYSESNTWSASSDKGALKWHAAYGNTGKILTSPDSATDQILDASGCYN